MKLKLLENIAGQGNKKKNYTHLIRPSWQDCHLLLGFIQLILAIF